MAKGRFVLRYRGEGDKPDDDVAKVQELEGAVVVDASLPRMLLVESEAQPLRRLVDAMPDWVMGVDRIYEVPDTRKKVLRPPD